MAENYRPTGKEAAVCHGRYLLRKKIGRGSFGDIYMAYDTVTSTAVAIKLERKSIHYPQLEYEMSVYQILHPFRNNTTNNNLNTGNSSGRSPSKARPNPLVPPSSSAQYPIIPGIPRAHQFVKEGEYNIMVLDLCGPSLEDVFNYCHRRFSLKTVLMLVEQMLHRIEYLHSKGFLHRDIKPENFVFGRGPLGHVLHMIDFGLAKPYIDKKTRKHVAFADKKPLTGTARYCACNAHKGYEQSRRDDLESIGFLLIYFIKGILPWQGIQGKDQRIKTQKIGEKKIATSLESLCEGLPPAFLTYMTYCRNLEFSKDPDYDYLRELFRAVAREHHYTVSNTSSGINNLPQPLGTRMEPSIFNSSSLRSPVNRTANASSFNPHPTDNSSENESYQTIHVMDSDDMPMNMLFSPRASTRSSPYNGNGSIKAALPAQPRIYDWNFDWFCKRIDEVRDFKANRQKGSFAGSSAPTQDVSRQIGPASPKKNNRN